MRTLQSQTLHLRCARRIESFAVGLLSKCCALMGVYHRVAASLRSPSLRFGSQLKLSCALCCGNVVDALLLGRCAFAPFRVVAVLFLLLLRRLFREAFVSGYDGKIVRVLVD